MNLEPLRELERVLREEYAEGAWAMCLGVREAAKESERRANVISRALAQLDDGWVRGVNAERREDMSPTGRLRLTAEEDGDMVVTVIAESGAMATVEFCNSGGKSPKTLDALRRLSVAIAEDAAARPLPSPPAQDPQP